MKAARLRGSVALAVLILPSVAWAQTPPTQDGGSSPGLWRFLGDSSRATWLRPLASAALPGSGQLLGGAERGAIYLAAEAFLLTRFLTLHHEATTEASRYRDLAFQVARGAYAPQIRDTVFDYFEAMGKYVESGPFDTDPGPGLVPPTDERTFNGHIWRLARETFFQDPDVLPPPDAPEYQQAIAFYRRRAVGADFEWSWRGAGLEQDLFRQTIRSSDDAFRSARRQLGLLLANHVLSAVDAFVAARTAGRSAGAHWSVHVRSAQPLGQLPGMVIGMQVRF